MVTPLPNSTEAHRALREMPRLAEAACFAAQVQTDRQKWQPGHAPALDVDELLEQLLMLDYALELVRAAAVAEMRQQGRSWSDVGTRLGVSKQAAQQRYGPRRSGSECVLAAPGLLLAEGQAGERLGLR